MRSAGFLIITLVALANGLQEEAGAQKQYKRVGQEGAIQIAEGKIDKAIERFQIYLKGNITGPI